MLMEPQRLGALAFPFQNTQAHGVESEAVLRGDAFHPAYIMTEVGHVGFHCPDSAQRFLFFFFSTNMHK